MRCLNQKCDADEIETDDNFCYKCGQWTARGYSFLKDKENVNMIMNGATVKQSGRLSMLGSLLALAFIIFTIMLVIRGEDLFKPFFYLKKQAFNYIYGYNTSLMKTDKKYNRKSINSYEEAIEFIKKDTSNQDFYCFNDIDVSIMASSIEEEYSIPSVSFCDMSVEESTKIKNVIDKMYLLFPNVKGALTNITITNASSKSEYIARFQPMYQFVNINESINSYNKVNKTQILINSYYFLNEDIMKNPVESVVGENWYVNDAIGYMMTPEQPLYYSDNCFGTADAISFDGKILRIHDLKTGAIPANMMQLKIYAAIFCLEYEQDPQSIEIELRIYQSDDRVICEPDADEIVDIMHKIIEFDKKLEIYKSSKM